MRLRNAALAILKRFGVWEAEDDVHLLSANLGLFRLVHRTPVQKLPKTSKQLKYRAASLRGDGPNLPYGLEVWTSKGKVLNVEWNDQGAVAVILRRPGSWEADLTEAAKGKSDDLGPLPALRSENRAIERLGFDERGSIEAKGSKNFN
jgi:hypothetical protein